ENVPKENVTVIDQNSNLLTKDINEEANGQASSETISKQHKAEEEYEDRLQKSIVSLLEPIVGKGNVTGVVKANLDFDSKQQTETTIDPNKVIVSQETLKETNKNGDGTASESPVDNNMSNEIVDNNSSSNSSKEEQKTNYDSGKSESKTIQAQGKVDRLTATVYLNKTLTQEEKLENVPKENVTVIDQNSNLLTKDINEEANGQASSETISKQHKAEQEYEDRLQKSIVSLLEPIVGKGNVTAVVKANLDFDSKQQTETTIDPNKVIVSQETLKESNKNGDGTVSESPVDNNMSNEIVNNNSSSNSSKEEQKTNYDSGKSESKTIQAQGKVDRLTATVYLNKTLTQEEKQEFEDGVANAIGIDATRGDQITVSGMTFDTSSIDKAQAALDEMNAEEAANKKTMMMIAGGVIGAILLGGIIIFILKRRKKKEEEEEQLLDTLIDDTIIPKEPDAFDPIEFETKTQKSHLENEIKKYATEKPEQVVEIIKSWLTENER
ncbi:flagellar M-ring protein FliF C-terminal domain-containing protein, partial [Clostridium butyricum]